MSDAEPATTTPWSLDTDALNQQLIALQETAAAIVRAYEVKRGFQRDLDAYALKVAEELGELVQAYLQHTKRRQDDGQTAARIWHNVENQATDVLMYLLIFCWHAEVDLKTALERKWFVFGHEVDAGRQHL